jgi:predicted PurR-regulated permease PerM
MEIPMEQGRTTMRETMDDPFETRVIEAAIRLAAVALLAFSCYLIVRPFVTPIVWGIIIAVAVYPLYLRLQARLGGRPKLAATLFTLAALALLIVPAVLLGLSLAESAQGLYQALHEGTLKVPPPADRVAEWPLIGEPVHRAWSLAATNLEAFVLQMKPQLLAVGKWAVGMAASTGGAILQFALALIIAGVLLVAAQSSGALARRLGERLAGRQGAEFVKLSEATIRSVAQGVLGVAIIQSVLAGVGLLAMDVPGAGIWALLVLLLAIMQLPPLLVLGPIVFYVFSVAETLPAVLFTVWSVLVSVSDSFLKPLLLGRGVDLPMLVVLLGAIGGMILSGIVRLFVGAVVLALGYKLFVAWLQGGGAPASEGGGRPAP